MKTKQELIEMCDNEHDRKLMIESLDKFDKRMTRNYGLLGLGVSFAIGGFILLNYGIIWGVIPLFASFLFFLASAFNVFREVGLF